MVFEWAETVTFLHNIDDGYYTLVADCVVLSREEQGDWVEHALDRGARVVGDGAASELCDQGLKLRRTGHVRC